MSSRSLLDLSLRLAAAGILAQAAWGLAQAEPALMAAVQQLGGGEILRWSAVALQALLALLLLWPRRSGLGAGLALVWFLGLLILHLGPLGLRDSAGRPWRVLLTLAAALALLGVAYLRARRPRSDAAQR